MEARTKVVNIRPLLACAMHAVALIVLGRGELSHTRNRTLARNAQRFRTGILASVGNGAFFTKKMREMPWILSLDER